MSSVELDVYIDMDYYVHGEFRPKDYQLGQNIQVIGAREIGGSYQFSKSEIEDANFTEMLGSFAEGNLNILRKFIRDNNLGYTLKDFGFISVE